MTDQCASFSHALPLLFLLLLLLLLLAACPAATTTTTATSWSFSLAPAQSGAGRWQEFPLAAASHLNGTGARAGATSFWRADGRHPWNRFDEVRGRLPLDRFTVAVWVKVDAAFFRAPTFGSGRADEARQSGVFWELSCLNCDGAAESAEGAPYVRHTQQQAAAAAAAAAAVCPVSVRLEATPQQAVVHTVAPGDQALAACAPVPQQTQIINGVQKVADGRWHHVAVVFDAALPTNNANPSVVARDYRLELWVDGKLDGTAEGPQNLRVLQGRVARELTVGRVSDFTTGGTANPNYMRSVMDSLEVRARALSAGDIAALAAVNCVMGEWSAWSHCKDEAGSAGSASSYRRERTRSRGIKQWPLNGGSPCSTVLAEKKACVTEIGSTQRGRGGL
jgi:hypothetical protein